MFEHCCQGIAHHVKFIIALVTITGKILKKCPIKNLRHTFHKIKTSVFYVNVYISSVS